MAQYKPPSSGPSSDIYQCLSEFCSLYNEPLIPRSRSISSKEAPHMTLVLPNNKILTRDRRGRDRNVRKIMYGPQSRSRKQKLNFKKNKKNKSLYKSFEKKIKNYRKPGDSVIYTKIKRSKLVFLLNTIYSIFQTYKKSSKKQYDSDYDSYSDVSDFYHDKSISSKYFSRDTDCTCSSCCQTRNKHSFKDTIYTSSKRFKRILSVQKKYEKLSDSKQSFCSTELNDMNRDYNSNPQKSLDENTVEENLGNDDEIPDDPTFLRLEKVKQNWTEEGIYSLCSSDSWQLKYEDKLNVYDKDYEETKNQHISAGRQRQNESVNSYYQETESSYCDQYLGNYSKDANYEYKSDLSNCSSNSVQVLPRPMDLILVPKKEELNYLISDRGLNLQNLMDEDAFPSVLSSLQVQESQNKKESPNFSNVTTGGPFRKAPWLHNLHFLRR